MDSYNATTEDSFEPNLFDYDPVAPREDTLDDPALDRRQASLRAAAATPSAEPRTPRQPRTDSRPSRAKKPKAAPAAKRDETDSALDMARPLISMVRDSRTGIFFGIILALATVYLLVVTISYFATVTHDQPSVLNNTFDSLVALSAKVSNAGGPLGAWLGSRLITGWLGVGVFVLLFYMAMISLRLLKVVGFNFWRLSFRCFFSAIAISIIVGLATWSLESPVAWGGAHGHFFNKMLIDVGGWILAAAVTVVMASLMILIFLDRLRRFWKYSAACIHERSERIAERRRIERARKEAEARRVAEERAAAKAAEEAARRREEPHAPRRNAEGAVESPAGPATIISLAESMPEGAGASEPEIHDAGADVLPTVGEMQVTVPVIEEGDTDSPGEEEAAEAAEAADPGLYDPRAELSHYRFPTLDLLQEPHDKEVTVDASEQEENKERITKTLLDYGIAISRISATVGPTVTLYEIVPAEGVRIAKIKRLEDDIALSLAALGIRIIAPIPGKGTVGIEVPNKDPQTVAVRSILGSRAYQDCRMDLPMALGSTISNEVFIADLAKMPHLLVAGATGMGKSVGLNVIIASLLYKKHPSELKFVFVDPKRVEFSLYASLEHHYLAKLPGDDDAIITDPQKVVATLNSLCMEMDNRYGLLKEAGCRNLREYNDKFRSRHLNPEKGHRFLPYIVVVVDEFADLMVTAGKEVEKPIARIAQMARAVGIHMILATQRPSTNVITGVIKANFPGRIAFRVFQMVDSRTILDRPGANQLIGSGDMLFSNNGKVDRVQCAFIRTQEVEAICENVSSQIGYACAYELPEYIPEDVDTSGMGSISDRDSLFEETARYVAQSSTASTSSLQRRYSIGYNRAGKIMDQLEAAGVVGPAMGGKPRQVLMDPMMVEQLLAAGNN